MSVVVVVLCAVGSIAFVGRGLWTLFRGGPLAAKSSGLAWASAGKAAVFWLLIGAALLAAGLLRVGARTQVIGPDAGFWLSFTPLILAGLALTLGRPRRVISQPR